MVGKYVWLVVWKRYKLNINLQYPKVTSGCSSRVRTCANIFCSKLFVAAADYKSELVGSQIQTVCLENQLSLFLAGNTHSDLYWFWNKFLSRKTCVPKKNYRMIKINCEEGRIDFEQGLIWKLCFAGSYFLLMLRLLLLLPRLPITSCNFPQHHQNQPYSLSLIFSLTLLASSSLSA